MSKIEVNQISSQCGSTLTVGQSGDTVTLASGATQTGFGRTGTVNWDTTAKTASFTAVSGNGYFVNTTSGAVTMTLPATPSAGNIVSVKDYAYTFATNNLIVNRNGSPIGGGTGSDTINYSTNGDFLTFIYVDGTRGWVLTNDSTNTDQAVVPFIEATGGTVTCCGDYKIHTFTGPGTFTVTNAGSPVGSNTVDYFVVAGGGGGAANNGGGGGAGGFRLSNSTCMPAPLTSPLANPSGLPVSVSAYPISVGGGGAGAPFPAGPNIASNGSNSIFSTITSAGGGGGATNNAVGIPGGSGGGGRGAPSWPGTGFAGGTGNTPPVSPPQGNNGGRGADGNVAFTAGGGGGGGGAVGSDAGASCGPAGNGGTGSYIASSGFAGCNGTPGPVCGARYFSGGGGGSINVPSGAGVGGTGGGGDGTCNSQGAGGGTAGTTNTGGGGGSETGTTCGNAGGSGIVIIRYKYQ